MSRPSFRVLRNSFGIALVGALSLSTVTVPAASAAATLTCNTAVNVFGVTPSGSFFVYPHNEPENGNFDWGAKQSGVGSGWEIGRTLAGPDGVVYSMVGSTGELRRFRWLGDHWANGGTFRSVGNGWGRYHQAEHRNKVTIDEKGRLYEINADGYLKMFVWEGDDETGGWTAETGGGKVLDAGWNQYNLVVAAGDGVLYARKHTGELYRFRYDAASDRFTQYAKPSGVGWNMFNRMFSPGGDILYGTRADNGGELLWYRYNESTETWADTGRDVGKLVGTGWYGELDVVADTNGCRLSGYPQPTRPAVPAKFDAPLSIVEGTDKLANYFYVNPAGGLTHGKQRRSDDPLLIDHQTLPGHDKYTGTPGAAVHENDKLEVQGHSYEAADTYGKTQATANGTWAPGLWLHRGHLLSDPVLAAGSDDLISAFGVSADGKLWYRKQVVANGAFPAWREIGSGGLTPDFSVVRSGDGFEVVARFSDNTVRVARVSSGVLGGWRNLGAVNATGKPAAGVHADGKLEVLTRASDAKIYRQRENSAGFPGTWTVIDGISTAGSPAAVVTTRDTVEASVRGTDQLVYTSGQNSPGGSFRAWEVRDFHEAATDVAMATLSNGNWYVSWRDPQGEIYTYLGSYGVAPLSAQQKTTSAAGASYAGGKSKK